MTTSRRAAHCDQRNPFEPCDAVAWVNSMKLLEKTPARLIPETTKIKLSEREWFRELPMYALYRIMRTFFVSFWFYVSPIAALSLQFIIPFVQILNENSEHRELLKAEASAAAAVIDLLTP